MAAKKSGVVARSTVQRFKVQRAGVTCALLSAISAIFFSVARVSIRFRVFTRMNKLYFRALRLSIYGFLAMAALLFVPAGTLDYWQGDVFFGRSVWRV